MRAGHRFLQVLRGLDGDALARATGVTARLFGSLSATGRGHGTDRALVAGCWAIARKRWSRPF
ncbi:serine dehydratase beta chain [Desulfohalovibrio reitneri]|uniref:serine dehydratase beta chain n=1 Tax=Desulfohalovibrio reitneri TaxID=1307759 RepID=UPI0004A77D69